MSAVSRLSQCKTIEDFNAFSEKLTFNEKSWGRSFTYICENGHSRSYTMNQIATRFNKCIKNSERPLGLADKNERAYYANWKLFRNDVTKGLEIVDELNAIPSKNKTFFHKISKNLGNDWYSLTHRGSPKNVSLNHIHMFYSDIYSKVSQRIVDQATAIQDTAIDITWIKEKFESNNCYLNDALEDEKARAILLQNQAMRKAIITYAKVNNLITDFLEADLENAFYSIFNNLNDNGMDADAYRISIESSFQEQGYSLNEILENSKFLENSESRDLIFKDPILRTALVEHAQENELNIFLEKHLDFLFNDVMSTPQYLATFIWICSDRREGRSLREILDNPTYLNDPSNRLTLLEYAELAPGLVYYAKVNNLAAFLTLHLEHTYHKVFDNVESYIVRPDATATDRVLASSNATRATANSIEAAFHRRERSLKEVLNLPALINLDTFPKDALPAIIYYAKKKHHLSALNFLLNGVFNGVIDSSNQLFNKYDLEYLPRVPLNAKPLSLEHFIDLNCKLLCTSLAEVFLDDRILNNAQDRSKLFQNERFRRVLVSYAIKTDSKRFLSEHLKFLCQKIFHNRNAFITNANSSMRDPATDIAEAIENEFRIEGRHLTEIVKIQSLVNIFSPNKLMRDAIDLFIRKINISKETSQSDLEARQILSAKELGKQHAQAGAHLVPKLNLQNSLKDMATLKKATKRFLLANHPDHNKNVDLELVKDATELLSLINNGHYKVYNAAYKNELAIILG